MEASSAYFRGGNGTVVSLAPHTGDALIATASACAITTPAFPALDSVSAASWS